MASHFLKVFATFVAMIALGLAGIYLINTYGKVPTPGETPGVEAGGLAE